MVLDLLNLIYIYIFFIKALDLILLYLRIVHCVDYYNGNEYNHEEEMPVRCGIMHIRGNATEFACKKDGKFFFHKCIR